MFYTILFEKYLNRAKDFDVYSSVRPVSSVSGTKTFNKNYLSIVEQVFDAFDDPMLLSVLRALETAMLSLDTVHRNRTSFHRDSENVAGSTDAHAKVIQSLLNSGHDSKSKLTQLGEKQDAPPVFALELCAQLSRKERGGTAENVRGESIPIW